MNRKPMPGTWQFELLNRFQRDFPILPRPFAALAAQLDASEVEVIETLRELRTDGLLSRVGAVFRPNVVGVSALAALAVPPERLDAVAKQVSAWPEVNHNYEREHRFNLWFVVTASDAASLNAVFHAIENTCGCGAPLVLPMLREFHIDLGFNLTPDAKKAPPDTRAAPAAIALSDDERALIATIQDGLPLVERPFAALGCGETKAIKTLTRWIETGVIKRFGVIVRHHELGFTDNAMVVMDVPDDAVEQVGRRIAASGLVTLCYRRPRQLPEWPYSLFCMMHGKDRAEVEARIVALATTCELETYPRAILFSRRRFKQCGARYATLPELEHGRT